MSDEMVQAIHAHLCEAITEASPSLHMLTPPSINIESLARPSVIKVFLLETGVIQVWHIEELMRGNNKQTTKWFEIDISHPDSLERVSSVIKGKGHQISFFSGRVNAP
jgi:hypothetical protein